MTYKLDPFQKIIYINRYQITPNFTTRNEGQSVVFTITANGVANGTVVYWVLEGVTGNITNSDFTSPSSSVTSGGSVTINNNTASFTVAISNDVQTEGSESFHALLKTGSSTGTTVATSATVTIIDTSTDPALTVTNLGITTIYDATWSPDGTKLALGHDEWHVGNTYYYATILNVSNSSTSIYNRFGTTDPSYGCDGHSIDWSPDGTKIAITGNLNKAAYNDTGHSPAYTGTLAQQPATLEVYNISTGGILYALGYFPYFPDFLLYAATPVSARYYGYYSDGGCRWVSNTRFVIGNGYAFDYNNSPPSTSIGPILSYRYKEVNPTSSNFSSPTVQLGALAYPNGSTSKTGIFYDLYGDSIGYISYTNTSNTWTVAPTPSHPTGQIGVENYSVRSPGNYVVVYYGPANSYDNTFQNIVLYINNTIAATTIPEDGNIHQNDSFGASAVAYSPDGTKIVISSGLMSRGKMLQLYTKNGTTLTYQSAFGPNWGANIVSFMFWNPQSSKLAVIFRDGTYGIYVV